MIEEVRRASKRLALLLRRRGTSEALGRALRRAVQHVEAALPGGDTALTGVQGAVTELQGCLSLIAASANPHDADQAEGVHEALAILLSLLPAPEDEASRASTPELAGGPGTAPRLSGSTLANIDLSAYCPNEPVSLLFDRPPTPVEELVPPVPLSAPEPSAEPQPRRLRPEPAKPVPFPTKVLHLVDEEAHPIVTVLVKATFKIVQDARCSIADEQLPITLTGQVWGSDPETSSYRYEPEVAFVKPATDVVLIGQAHAPARGTTEMQVGLRVGSVQHVANVVGDRVWFKSLGSVEATKPVPFEAIPLQWERAFGGWDRAAPDPKQHACERRNPVGLGMRSSRIFEEGLRLPNLEHPEHPLWSFGDVVPPVGFGFVSPHWEPRASFAGTFDEAWQKGRAPLLPKDFSRRHLNAAAPGLVAPGHLRGDEPVVAVGVHRRGPLRFALPGLPPPIVRIALRGGGEHVVPALLDTLVIEPDEERVLMLWRACVSLRTGPLDAAAIVVTQEAATS